MGMFGRGWFGSAYGNAASIAMKIDGTPGSWDTPGRIEFGTTPDGQANTQTRMVIKSDGNVGIGTTSPQGKLDVNGTIYQRGGQLHADYVFEPGYRLESITEHAEFMWANKHLKAVPKAMKDENGSEIVEFGSQQRGIVEELEKAHIYIEQLQERIKTLEAKMDRLAAEKYHK